MEEFFNQLLGQQGGGFHLAGLVFSLIGALMLKWHFWQKHRAALVGTGLPIPVFKWRVWFRQNWDSVLMSVVGSFILVRFIVVFLNWIGVEDFKFFGTTIPVTTDTIFYYFLGGALIQIWIHIKYDRKKK